MRLITRPRLFASTVIVSLALSGLQVPGAIAYESNQPDTLNCPSTESMQPAQVPYEAIAAAQELLYSGAIDPELVTALSGTDIDYEIVGPSPRILPAIAAGAVAVAGWCARGALSSLGPSVLQELLHRANEGVPPPDWVMNAILGCATNGIAGILTTQTMRVKFAAAILALVIKLRNFG